RRCRSIAQGGTRQSRGAAAQTVNAAALPWRRSFVSAARHPSSSTIPPYRLLLMLCRHAWFPVGPTTTTFTGLSGVGKHTTVCPGRKGTLRDACVRGLFTLFLSL